jgi:hypothetical protein
MKYIVKINKTGYYSSKHLWQTVSRDDATIFNSRKQARVMLNRLVGRLMKDSIDNTTGIEPL